MTRWILIIMTRRLSIWVHSYLIKHSWPRVSVHCVLMITKLIMILIMLFTSAVFPNWYDGAFFFVSTVSLVSFLSYCSLQRWYFSTFPPLLITSLSSSEQFPSLFNAAFLHLTFANLHYSIYAYYNYHKYDKTFTANVIKRYLIYQGISIPSDVLSCSLTPCFLWNLTTWPASLVL